MDKFTIKRIVGIIISAIIIGPIVIHIFYKLHGPEWIVAEWSAGDILQYYGMILTTVIAIGGLFLTFQDNRNGIREQSRLDQLPYFSLTTFNCRVRNPLLGTTTDKEIVSKAEKNLKPNDNKEKYYYIEEKINSAFLIIRNRKAFIETHLSENDKKLIINGGYEEQRINSGRFELVNKPMTYVPFLLRNVGKGAAIDFRIGFNVLIDGELKNPQYLSSTSINVEEEFYLGLFSNHEDNNEGEYLLEIVYNDIFDNQYKQSTIFKVKTEKDAVIIYMDKGFKQKNENKNIYNCSLKSLFLKQNKNREVKNEFK